MLAARAQANTFVVMLRKPLSTFVEIAVVLGVWVVLYSLRGLGEFWTFIPRDLPIEIYPNKRPIILVVVLSPHLATSWIKKECLVCTNTAMTALGY